jgi:hypothetical protein
MHVARTMGQAIQAVVQRTIAACYLNAAESLLDGIRGMIASAPTRPGRPAACSTRRIWLVGSAAIPKRSGDRAREVESMRISSCPANGRRPELAPERFAKSGR